MRKALLALMLGTVLLTGACSQGSRAEVEGYIKKGYSKGDSIKFGRYAELKEKRGKRWVCIELLSPEITSSNVQIMWDGDSPGSWDSLGNIAAKDFDACLNLLDKIESENKGTTWVVEP